MYPSTIFLVVFITASLLVGPAKPSLPPLPRDISEDLTTNATALYRASIDFGNITQAYPAAVLLPESDDVIAKLIRYSYGLRQPFPISAKGNAHSTDGQAQAGGGVVVEMKSLPLSGSKNDFKFGDCRDGSRSGGCYVDVSGGHMWIDVLLATTQQGLAPRSWTDYLYLTVGGTLSNAGISGQAFRFGPQISNVLELDVVTGKGETLTCSPEQNSDLFYGVLGGLGQFGIITRARIILEKAPDRGRWLRMAYTNFTEFTKDQEYLISLNGERDRGFDYVEGFIMIGVPNGCNSEFNGNNSALSSYGNSTVLYCLEVCKYYTNSTDQHLVDEEVSRLVNELHYLPGMLGSKDVTYIDFLNRVRQTELLLRSLGLWKVPHPWLTLFVPGSRILEFHDVVIKGIVSQSSFTELIIAYPFNRNKWDQRTSAVVPPEDVFYLVDLLRTAVTDWELQEEENKRILAACKERGIELKEYLPEYREESEWRRYYGEEGWATLLRRKAKYDPRGILATGQQIFPFPLEPSFFKIS